MNVSFAKKSNYAIASLWGKMDASTSPELEDQLMGLIDEDITNIILDMAGVSYLSSAGLRILMRLAKRLSDNGQLILCNVQDIVEEIIDMAGFKNFIILCPSLQDAESNILI